jgi:hypothetical protein
MTGVILDFDLSLYPPVFSRPARGVLSSARIADWCGQMGMDPSAVIDDFVQRYRRDHLTRRRFFTYLEAVRQADLMKAE